MIEFSVLDLSPILAGSDARQSLHNSRDLAQHAEKWGYKRYWLAEHHNMPGIASSATAVAIGYVAEGTSTIRVGSGGIMLPNHAPLMIAEQFGTLESLYPGRIDLGLGRAPGTDQRTAQALRRYFNAADNFPQDVQELLAWFRPAIPNQAVRAVPGEGLDVPVWILGSSLFGAQVAAHFGLPFGFASHFAPDYLMEALKIYRAEFKPSQYLQQSYALAGVSTFAADTDEEARRLFTSAQQQFINLRRGTPTPLQPPIDDMDAYWTPREKAQVLHAQRRAVVGAPDTVHRGLAAFIEETGVDEVMIASQIFDHRARLRSYEIVAGLREGMAAERAA
ncbi:MAG: LLM class flavin-dependent oxidoreductase [Alphaproteobacteria bacterium]|nr:LLM class flavin-dependent oxidoreductase [Alphaproteobacteria bacterium]MCW5740408.1 LLM class flavin-dependent oxidoreductase [Alphaproteobacteria bacterium]